LRFRDIPRTTRAARPAILAADESRDVDFPRYAWNIDVSFS